MTEPIYEYVRGQGWVLQTEVTPYQKFKDDKGKTWTCYKRVPRIGERWEATTAGYQNIKEFVETFCEGRSLRYFPVLTEDYKPDRAYPVAWAIVPYEHL